MDMTRPQWPTVARFTGALFLTAVVLAGCSGKPIPPEADHPMIWWVGLTLGGFLLTASGWLVNGMFRGQHGRRSDRRDDRLFEGKPGDRPS